MAGPTTNPDKPDEHFNKCKIVTYCPGSSFNNTSRHAKDKSSFKDFSPFIQLRKELFLRWNGILKYVQSSLNIDLVITKDHLALKLEK